MITGASGMLGYALCRQALAAYDVYGVCHKGHIAVDGVTPIRADLTDKVQLTDCFKQARPQAVIHAAALSQPNDCEQQPEVSEKINLRAVAEIAGLCRAAAIPLVFTSSDLVFNGQHPPYTEEDQVSPICLYGRHKANAEMALRENYPEATICRMPLMLGHAPETGSGFLGHMARCLQKSQELTLFTDEIRTPVDIDSAARGLFMALEKKGAMFHLGGRLRMSRFSMGCLVADILKAEHALLKTVRIEDLPMPAPRSPDVSLSSEQAYALGYAPEDLASYLERTVPRIVL